jgi:hypothetical protein
VKGPQTALSIPPFSQTLPSIALAPGYDSNPPATRNIFPNTRYNQQPINEAEKDPGYAAQLNGYGMDGGAFDETVTSGFEDTKSDVRYGNEKENDEGPMGEDYELPKKHRIQPDSRQGGSLASKHFPPPQRPGLHHKQSRSPLIEEEQQNANIQPHGIVGRFESRGEQWEQDVAHRGGNGQPVDFAISGHPSYPAYSGGAYEDKQQGMDFLDSEGYDSGEELDLSAQQDSGDDCMKHVDEGEPHTEGADSTVPAVNYRQAIECAMVARFKNAGGLGPDYDDEVLAKMTYSGLKKESWDGRPFQTKRRNQDSSTERPISNERVDASSTPNQAPEFSFAEGFHYAVTGMPAHDQVEFFESLSMEDFERTGDLFIDKFTDLMQKIKQARKNKREMILGFEKEIEAREKVVRGKSENLDKMLVDMRAGGQAVLRGKV